MAFALVPSLSALLPSATGALFNFAVATTVKSVRLTNTHTAAVTISLWFDYDGTLTNVVDKVLHDRVLGVGESVLLDGGPWHFAAASRISGLAGTANVVTVHVTPATI